MKEGKSAKLNGVQQHQNGHLSPFKFAKLLDPEASWDKVILAESLFYMLLTLFVWYSRKKTKKERMLSKLLCRV